MGLTAVLCRAASGSGSVRVILGCIRLCQLMWAGVQGSSQPNSVLTSATMVPAVAVHLPRPALSCRDVRASRSLVTHSWMHFGAAHAPSECPGIWICASPAGPPPPEPPRGDIPWPLQSDVSIHAPCAEKPDRVDLVQQLRRGEFRVQLLGGQQPFECPEAWLRPALRRGVHGL